MGESMGSRARLPWLRRGLEFRALGRHGDSGSSPSTTMVRGRRRLGFGERVRVRESGGMGARVGTVGSGGCMGEGGERATWVRG